MKIGRWNLGFSLPLLSKELIEMAARKRTYVLRVVAALLLYLIGWAVVSSELRYGRNNGFELLGTGDEVVQMVAWCLLAGIYLFLPAVMCPAIASERESGTLTLILITPMRPWQIVLQKLGGRLVPVLSLLLLALPLLGVAYTLGGIVSSVVWDSAYVLLVAAVQVGAITLMWSAFCRSPAGAFTMSYVTLAALYLGWPLLIAMVDSSSPESAMIAFFAHPPAMLVLTMFGGWPGAPSPMALSIGSWVTAFIALLLARVFVVSRQDVRRRSQVRQFVRAVDTVLNPGAASTASESGRSLPDDKPIAWSELHRRALGRLRYLVIITLGLELPVLGIALLIYADYARHGYHYGQIEGMTVFMLFLWPFIAFLLTMVSAGLFATERNRQTLDVLLTTPIPTGQIVRQKLAGVSRMQWVLAAPLLTLVALEANYEWGHVDDPTSGWYLVISLAAIAVYFWMTTWLSMWIGLWSRSPRRAVMTAMGVIIGICVVPLVVALLIAAVTWNDDPAQFVMGFSPAAFVLLLEVDELDELGPPIVASVLHLGWWFAVGLFARFKVLSGADRLLGRVEGYHGSV